MKPGIDFHVIQSQRDLPKTFHSWMKNCESDVLESPWVVVSSAAMRQRLDWDYAITGEGDAAVASNFEYLFPEEFVGLVEEIALTKLGLPNVRWDKSAIAVRLAELSEGETSWSAVLAEASTIDDGVRWRSGVFSTSDLSPSSHLLLKSEEWVLHGPLAKRKNVLNAIKQGLCDFPEYIALYGMDNAPGGTSFIKIVEALATKSSIGVFVVDPRSSADVSNSSRTPISWWKSIDEHLSLWRGAGVKFKYIVSEHETKDLDILKIHLAGESSAEELLGDGSVGFYGGVGASRQVEIIRDQILHHLENSDVEPHEILVTSPAIDKFLPFIARHWDYDTFSNEGERQPRVPYELVEKKIKGLKNKANLISSLLNLIGNYLTANQIVGLLQYPSLIASLQLSEEDISRIGVLTKEAHVVFGASQEQRSHLELFTTSYDVGTWRRFFDRLAYTAMMPDNLDDVDQLGTGNDIFYVGGLRKVLDAIESAQIDLESHQKNSMVGWTEWIVNNFSHLLNSSEIRDESLVRGFEKIANDFADRETPIEVSFEFFRQYWEFISSSGMSAQAFGRYGVHVAPISSMPNSSYKYVFILGLDEDCFPTASLRSSAMFPVLPGDPDPRAAVLASLLLTINAAQNGVYFSFTNRNELNGEATEKSVVLEELLESIGDQSINFISFGARHAFVIPNDKEDLSISFDSRYKNLGDAIINSPKCEPLQVANIAAMSQIAEKLSDREVIIESLSIKDLQRFLNNSAAHFVQRGLLGDDLGRIELDEDVPRVGYSALTNHNLRLEIIENLAGLRNSVYGKSGRDMFDEILSRESMGKDINKVFHDVRFDAKINEVAEWFIKDLACYDSLDEVESEAFYAPISLENGLTLTPRLSIPDERRPWTVFKDFSAQNGGSPGVPSTFRFYPNSLDSPKDRRDSLSMMVDLLVMKVNQPDSVAGSPVSTLFWPNDGKKSAPNPQISYRYSGDRIEAIQLLTQLTNLYVEGLLHPVAIGRYTTPIWVEGIKSGSGFFKDIDEPLFKMIFGDDVQSFFRLAEEQKINNFIMELAKNFSKSRDTATERIVRRYEEANPELLEKYLPLLKWDEQVKLAKAAKKAK